MCSILSYLVNTIFSIIGIQCIILLSFLYYKFSGLKPWRPKIGSGKYFTYPNYKHGIWTGQYKKYDNTWFPDGYGTIFLGDTNEIYKGNVYHCLFQGKGIFWTREDWCFSGIFFCGKFTHGIVYYPNGYSNIRNISLDKNTLIYPVQYEGIWKTNNSWMDKYNNDYGYPDGSGTMYYSNGTIRKGLWEKGIFKGGTSQPIHDTKDRLN